LISPTLMQLSAAHVFNPTCHRSQILSIIAQRIYDFTLRCYQ
jgi:hypothetical protein